jgi:hypothetical protein
MATSGTFGYRVEGREGSVKIEGLSKVRRDLKKLAKDVDYGDQFLALNKRLADAVTKDSMNHVPVRTGALLGSLRAAASSKSARVKAGYKAVPYAGPIHFGWPARFIKPQPFIYDAIDKRRREVAERYAELITKLIRTNDLDGRR